MSYYEEEVELRMFPGMEYTTRFFTSELTDWDVQNLNGRVCGWLADFEEDEEMEYNSIDYVWREFYALFMRAFMKLPSVDVVTTPIHQSRKIVLNDSNFRNYVIYNVLRKRGDIAENFAHSMSERKNVELTRAVTENGYELRNLASIAEYANDFLVQLMNPEIEVERKNHPNTFKPFYFSEEMVYELLRYPKMSSLHTTGMTLMSANMLKITAHSASRVLYRLYEKSLDEAQLPDDWRHTLIVLKYKEDGDPTYIGNYRPIGITCSPVKILEIIISKYLHSVMEKRWNPYQHGNRKEHSQESQVVCVHEQLLLRAYKYGRVDCVRLDFTKAADMVVHSILVEKLRELCVDPKVVNWIRAFLSNRLQSVKVSGVISEPREVTSGLPQGSPLSNVLLMIYLNDLVRALDNEEIYQYSDDTLITRRITCRADCLKLQQTLDYLETWMHKHHMRINMKKCHVLTFTLKDQLPDYSRPFQYTLHGEQIELVHEMKYLGIYMTDDFSWTRHIDYLYSKLEPDFRYQMELLSHCGRDSAQINYYTKFLRVRLEKCSSAWAPDLVDAERSVIEKLENLQDDTLRYVRGGHNLASLVERRLCHLMVLLFGVLNRQKPYQKISKMLDIWDPNFSLTLFEVFFKRKESIIGRALKELMRFNQYIADYRMHKDTLFDVMRHCSSNNNVLREYCNNRANEYSNHMDPGRVEFSRFALQIVSQCLHQNRSVKKIQDKIAEIFEKPRSEIPVGVIALLYAVRD